MHRLFLRSIVMHGNVSRSFNSPKIPSSGVISDFTLACVHNEHGKGKLV